MQHVDLLVALVGGTLLGVLAKAAAPGDRSRIPLWLTVICGVAGVVAGTYAYGAFFDVEASDAGWWRHLWQAVFAIVLVGGVVRFSRRAG